MTQRKPTPFTGGRMSHLFMYNFSRWSQQKKNKKEISRKGSSKGQSAMEYLMTYGWSILIIAITLITLFELGIFNNNSFSGNNSCVSVQGVSCTSPTLNTNGVLQVNIGISFNPIIVTGFACINTTFPPSISSFEQLNNLPFYPNVRQQMEFQCPVSSNSIGTSFSGSLWIEYTQSNTANQILMVGKVSIKSSTTSAFQQQIDILQPASMPSGVAKYVPIILKNSQNHGTGLNFQQMITLNAQKYSPYEANNMQNVEFFYSNGIVINSWLEGNFINENNPNSLNTATSLVYWLTLNDGITAANSIIIFMGFQPISTNLFSSSGPIGTAPQLFCSTGCPETSYAQYDNGANVFQIYGNWEGSTAPSDWTPISSKGSFLPTFIQGSSSGGGKMELMNNVGSQATALKYTSPFTTQNIIVESSWEYNGIADNFGIGLYAGGINTWSGGYDPSAVNPFGEGFYNSYEYYYGDHPEIVYQTLSGSSPQIAYATSSLYMPNNNNIYALSQVISTPNDMQMNLTTTTTGAYQTMVYSGLTDLVSYTGVISNINNIFYLGAGTGGAVSFVYLYWLRVRSYPPNGVMPSVSFGSLT